MLWEVTAAFQLCWRELNIFLLAADEWSLACYKVRARFFFAVQEGSAEERRHKTSAPGERWDRDRNFGRKKDISPVPKT